MHMRVHVHIKLQALRIKHAAAYDRDREYLDGFELGATAAASTICSTGTGLVGKGSIRVQF